MSKKNKELFCDIAHDVPLNKSRSFLDCDTIKFKNSTTGELMEATEWFIDDNGAFVIKLSEAVGERQRFNSLGELICSAMAKDVVTA